MIRHIVFRRTLIYLYFVVGITVSASLSSSTVSIASDMYANLLCERVKNGMVDYEAFKKNEALLDKYLKILEETDIDKLSWNDQFAFYINAYNAWTIKLILSAYPGIQSIKELGSLFRTPWKRKIARIGGEIMTLDTIEHEILRPRFKDPRVHFAVNCASRSCPPLRWEPYRGDILDRQLTEMTEAFINDPHHNRLQNSTLYVSSIFKWYSEDFNEDVIGFFMKYARGDLEVRLKKQAAEIKIRYLDYDWSLNGT